jgi:cytochrome c peroxidase
MRIAAALLLSVLVLPFLTVQADKEPSPSQARPDPAMLQSFAPLPAVVKSAANPLTAAKVSLGRMLYYDPRLSRNQQISCNTCHPLDHYGVDGERVSTGFKDQHGTRNAPSVYNAAGHAAQFWDGRAPTVEAQASGPMLNPVEMAMPSQEFAVEVLKSMPAYVAAFQKAFPGEKDPVTLDNAALAIGAFERELVTPSRWDKFLKGDPSALNDREIAGLNEFLETGCQLCHSGAYVGGEQFMKLGVVKPWPGQSDLGRFAVTHQAQDRLVFKVPSLRNVAETGPYFHDGSVRTLDQAVRDMAEYQLGKKLNRQQVQAIVVWLNSLTGELPQDVIRKPALPPSSRTTPTPEGL